jgi:transcriptional regulator with XRE-family HTH domain
MPERATILKRIGAAVRELRTRQGLTQAALAERADLVVETVSRLEAGKVNLTVEAVERLAAAGLGVTLTALLGPVPKVTTRPKVRPALARVVALLSSLSDEDLADVYSGLLKFLAVRDRKRLRRPTPRAHGTAKRGA